MKYKIDTSEIRVYNKIDSCVFKKNNDSFGDLSNMSTKYPIIVNGISIRTTEALYQACRFPFHPEIQAKILNEPNPMKVKMISNANKKVSRADWEEVKVGIMRWCLNVKLTQNLLTFGEILTKTGDKSIVENSARDNFWGAIPDKDQVLFKGKNALGRLLMELRSKFHGDWVKLLYIEPPKIPNLLIYSQHVKPIDERINFVCTLLEYWDKDDVNRLEFDIELKKHLLNRANPVHSTFGISIVQRKLDLFDKE